MSEKEKDLVEKFLAGETLTRRDFGKPKKKRG